MSTRIIGLLAATFIAAASGGASAQICAPSVVGGNGIGDGCTTVLNGVALAAISPSVAIFKGTFTPACDRHDKCYTTIGTTYTQCDGDFLSGMRAACSTFNEFLMPAEHFACMAAADEYYSGVKAWGAYANPLPGLQEGALTVSRQLRDSVNRDACGTTPERTTLYDTGLITQINSAWQQYAGRLPTIYEFLNVVNTGDIVANRTTWVANALNPQAMSAKSVHPPAVGSTFTMGNTTATLTASPVVAGATYAWGVSRNGSIYKGSGTQMSFPLYQPEYDKRYTVSGFVKATYGGAPNMALFERSVLERGWCSSSPDLYCY